MQGSAERVHEDAQYVASANDSAAAPTYGRRYVFATVDQNTVSASLRLNWTFKPTLSFQTYVQPFVSSAEYRNFKMLVRPRSYAFSPVSYSANPNLTVRSLKGSAVVRWEYQPGSAMFLVWTQDRSDYDSAVGDFRFHRDFSDLLRAHPDNIFLAKVSYYFNL